MTENINKFVRTKVQYNESDLPFNKYLSILHGVNDLTHKLLYGEINKFDTVVDETDPYDKSFKLNDTVINKCRDTLQLRYLELVQSLETRKTEMDNWQESNEKTMNIIQNDLNDKLPHMYEVRDQLRGKIKRLNKLYDNVNKINVALMDINRGNIVISVSKRQWNDTLGESLTDKLIQKKILKKENNTNAIDPLNERYSIYDNFTETAKIMKQQNINVTQDIANLNNDLKKYKENWLQDAKIFSKISSVLQDEIHRRSNMVDNNSNNISSSGSANNDVNNAQENNEKDIEEEEEEEDDDEEDEYRRLQSNDAEEYISEENLEVADMEEENEIDMEEDEDNLEQDRDDILDEEMIDKMEDDDSVETGTFKELSEEVERKFEEGEDAVETETNPDI